MAITGYPTSWRAPFEAVEVVFGQGPSNAASGPRAAIFTGPMTSTGTATANSVYEIKRESEAVALFGAGSPLHRAIRFYLRCYKLGRVYGQAYAASSGGENGASATGTITVSGTATAAGLLSFRVCGERMQVAFRVSGTPSTPTQIGDAIAASINAKTWLPVTAANSSGTVTLTAKILGASQGDGTVGVIRFAAEVEPGKGIAVATSGAALGLGDGTAGADGSTTEVSNLEAALASRAASWHYYQGFTAWSADATAAIETHVNTVSLPNPGLRCRAFCAWTGALSSLQTIAIARNHERIHEVWQLDSEHDPAEIVAQVVAAHQAEESLRGSFVPDKYRGGRCNWLLLPAVAEASWPDGDDVNDAVTDGIIPISSDQTGSTMVTSVNTRSKDAAGLVDDFRATESHRVSFMDELADTWLLRDRLTWQGFKLTDDERLPNGDINHNQELPPRTITPYRYQKWFSGIITEFAADGVLQRPDEWKESLSFSIESGNVSRITGSASGRTFDIRHQVELRISETTPG